MAVDLSSRLTRVFITNPDGSNSLDVSDLLLEISVSDQPLDQSGWIKTSGSMTLSVESFAFSVDELNPYENPERWSRGMRVLVQARKTNGDYVTHPRGELYIIRRPKPPIQSNEVGDRILQVDIGCEATLKDYRQPPEDASDIKLGTENAPSDVINRIASRAGFRASLIDLIIDNPLRYPVFDIGGSFTNLMGGLAYANIRVLYLDKQTNIKAQPIDLDPASADFEYVVGRDEQFFDPIPGSDRPVEIVKVTSTTQKLDDSNPGDEITVTTNPNTRTVTEYKNWRSNSPETVQTYEAERGIVLPSRYPEDESLMTRSIVSTESFYESLGDEKLKERVEIKYEPRAVVIPDQFEDGSFPSKLIKSEESITTYEYDLDVVEAIETNTYLTKGVVTPSLVGEVTDLSIIGLRLARRTRQEWREVGDRWFTKKIEYDYTETGSGGSAASAPTSSGTANQPPATERKNNDWSEKTKNITGEAKFSTGPGSEYDERTREFQLPPGVATSDEQLDKVAEVIGKVLQGRDFGWQFGVALTDEWLDRPYTPLVVMDWTYNNRKKRYLANGLSFVITKEESVVGGELIELGTLKVFAQPGNSLGIPAGQEITFNFDPQTGFNEAGLNRAQVEQIYADVSSGTPNPDFTPVTKPSFSTSVRLCAFTESSVSISVSPGDASQPIALSFGINTEFSVDISVQLSVFIESAAQISSPTIAAQLQQIEVVRIASAGAIAPPSMQTLQLLQSEPILISSAGAIAAPTIDGSIQNDMGAYEFSDLLNDLAVAAINAGGIGLTNWAIYCADDFNPATGIASAGGFGGTAAPVGAPIANASFSNGRASVVFNGTNQQLRTGGDSNFNSSVWTFLEVKRGDGWAFAQRYTSGGGSPGSTLMNGSFNGLITGRSSTGTYKTTAFSNYDIGAIVLQTSFWYANDSLQSFVDGVASNIETGANANPSGHVQLTIGGYNASFGVGYYTGEIAFVAMCNLDLTSQKSSVENAIRTYYGLQGV